MSAGAFTRTRYRADSGDTHPIRVQPETLTAAFGATANSAPTDAIDNPISAKVSNGNRAFGLKPRSVTIVFETNAPLATKLALTFACPYCSQLCIRTLPQVTRFRTWGNCYSSGEESRKDSLKTFNAN